MVISPIDNSELFGETMQVAGLSEPAVVIELTFDGKEVFKVTAGENGGWYFTAPNSFSLGIGAHSISARAVDTAGNTGQATVVKFKKITAPAVAPVQPIIPTPEITPTPTVVLPITIGAPPVAIPITPTAPPTPSEIKQVEQLVEISTLPPPKVMSVAAQVQGDIISFSGTAMPGEEVAVYIHSDEAVVYRTRADSQGIWRVNHSQNTVELSPGVHTVYSVGLNSSAQIKSRPSPIGSFTIEKNWLVAAFNYFSLSSSVITAFVLLLAMSWLYWIKRKENVAVEKV